MKSKAILALLISSLLAPALRAQVDSLPGASDNNFMRHKDRGSKLDRNALREQVDETQALIDALARESRGLSPAQTEPLFKSLNEEYHLAKYVGKTRKALNQAEEVLEVQEAVKLQQIETKKAGVSEQAAEDSKLLGLQSELVSVVDDLRGTLRDIHADADEDTARDLRNWIMISEGMLRNRREEAPSASSGQVLSVSAEAPLTYEGVSPVAGTAAVSAALSPAAAVAVTKPAAAAAKPAKKPSQR